MKPSKTLLLFTLSVTLLQSCKESPKSSGSENTRTAETIDSGKEDKQAFINKYNVYVDVWNSVSPSIERSYSLITANLDNSGKALAEKESYFISKALSGSTIKKLETMLGEEPEIPELDEIGNKLVSSFNTLEGPLEKLSDYYKAQSYLDDDFKTSIELYPVVMENMKAYLSASAQLGKELQVIDERLSNEELENYKKEGFEILYARSMLIKTMNEQTALLRGIDYDQYDAIDFEKFDEKLREVIAQHTTFKELSKNVPQLKKELNISMPARLTIFNTSVDKFVRESRNLKKLATTPKDYTRMKSTVASMGLNFASASHVKVFEAAEQVINQSNYLN